MRVSKFVKAHKDILLEYIYDDGNNISEGYKILVNSRDNTYSFVSEKLSNSNNTPLNQLFPLDKVTNYYGVVDTNNYSFLQYKDYPSGFPIRFDTLKIHLPINYTFGENIGCYVRIYSFDTDNKVQYNLSNFYYDQSDVNIANIISYSVPPLKFQEKLWGKSLNINIPSTYFVSRQMSGTSPKSNTINANLTNGKGLSQNTPIFIEFSFISRKTTINGVTGYYLSSQKNISLPQTPDYENLGVKIEPSTNGDFFEIYGIYNGTIGDFKKFIDNSFLQGKRFSAEFIITLFEQNIRGKSMRILITDDFLEKIEYRPIIKYTTTTAVIDVEMRLIDSVDDSMIYRRASYGMLQDEVSKFSLYLLKINLKNANKPKIYSLKNFNGLLGSGLDSTLFQRAKISGLETQNLDIQQPIGSNVILQPINIDRTVLVDKFNIIAKSENVNIGKNIFYGLGKLKIILQPFDNIILFVIAKDVTTGQTPGINTLGNLAFVKAPEYLDMSNMGEINFVIKNDTSKFETTVYTENSTVDLTRGQVVFRIPESSMKDVKRIFDSGQNVFYITSKLNSQTTVVYAGLFDIFDSLINIETINTQQQDVERDVLSAEKSDVLIDTYTNNNAIVYRRRIPAEPTTTTDVTTTGTSNPLANSSVAASILIDGITYDITTSSSIKIDGYEWTSDKIKGALNLQNNPTTLTFRDNSLFSNGQFLDILTELNKKLQNRYLATPEDLAIFQQEQAEAQSGTQSGP